MNASGQRLCRFGVNENQGRLAMPPSHQAIWSGQPLGPCSFFPPWGSRGFLGIEAFV